MINMRGFLHKSQITKIEAFEVLKLLKENHRIDMTRGECESDDLNCVQSNLSILESKLEKSKSSQEYRQHFKDFFCIIEQEC